MNKTVIFITFVVLAGLAVIGATVVLLLRPDSIGTFSALIVTVLSLATTAAGTFYGLGKQSEKLDEIKTQTNGTLSAYREQVADLQTQLLAAVAKGEHK